MWQPKVILLSALALVCLPSVLTGKDRVCQLIESNRYDCELHHVQTEDGYQLTLHRIPPPQNAASNRTSPLRPFVLMHGMIGSSADFVVLGRSRALSMLLYEQGFDVWVANCRGNTFSKHHQTLDVTDDNFWNFSWHEMGYYDLAAIVDYVLNETGQQQVHYAAHSQGSMILFVLLSERPEYNSRFATAALLAPVAFLLDIQSPVYRALILAKAEGLLYQLGLNELLSWNALNQLGAHLFCGEGSPTQNLCLQLTYLIVGFSGHQMDRSVFARIFDNTPAGMSRKQLIHFLQAVHSGKFQKYDFNSKSENYRHYGRKSPPEYNLRNVRVPLQLFFGDRDWIVVKTDVLRLTRQLKNTHYTLTEVRGFNHIDILYSTAAPRLVYNPIIKEAKSYYSKENP